MKRNLAITGFWGMVAVALSIYYARLPKEMPPPDKLEEVTARLSSCEARVTKIERVLMLGDFAYSDGSMKEATK